MVLLKNSIWNVLAVVIPALIAIPTFGILARYLGIELFGLFTLIFVLTGYASIFDAGFSRAVVREIALERKFPIVVKTILFTASTFIFLLGLIATVGLFLLAPSFTLVLNISEIYQEEVTYSLRIISFVLPVFLLTLIWMSYLEGLERFKELSCIRIVSNSLLSILPLAGYCIENNIVGVVYGLLGARLISFMLIFVYVKIDMVSNKVELFSKQTCVKLLHFGGWITLSNIISPVMVYFDRFILSSLSGANSVALYSAPAEIISKMLAIPMAFSKALFPYLASSRGGCNSSKEASLLWVMLVAIFMAMPLFIFAEQFLFIWLGDGYKNAALVMRILLLGFVFNSMAQIPYTKLQASGHSKITAIIHIFELVPYLLVLILLINLYSYVGVAIAWFLRVMFDFFALSIVSKRYLTQE